MSNFKGRAILLITAAGEQSDVEEIRRKTLAALAPFTLHVRENQSICLAGRLILAIDLDCDPVHVSAIEDDVRNVLSSHKCDVASEVI